MSLTAETLPVAIEPDHHEHIQTPPEPASASAAPAPHEHSESYIALVWRRLKRSWTGMLGLILVSALLLMAVFADFLSPVDPKATDVAFAPPQSISFPAQQYPVALPARILRRPAPAHRDCPGHCGRA